MSKDNGDRPPADDLRYTARDKLAYYRKCQQCGKLEQSGVSTIARGWLCLGCWVDYAMPGDLPADRGARALDTPAE